MLDHQLYARNTHSLFRSSHVHNGRRSVNGHPRTTVTWITGAAVLLALLATAMPAAAQCDVTADVVAMDQVITYNRLGAFAPTGMVYALARDVFPAGTIPADETLANSCAAVACSPPQVDGFGAVVPGTGVQMRSTKRPRPLTLRVNEGCAITLDFTNLLAPPGLTDAGNEAPGIQLPDIPSEQPRTRHAGIHIQGLQWTVSGGGDDGSNTGFNAPSLVPPGGFTSYTYYAEKEGAYVISSGPGLGGEGGSGAIANGLFGVLNVEPAGSEWYRSQLTRAEMFDIYGRTILKTSPDFADGLKTYLQQYYNLKLTTDEEMQQELEDFDELDL